MTGIDRHWFEESGYKYEYGCLCGNFNFSGHVRLCQIWNERRREEMTKGRLEETGIDRYFRELHACKTP